ncbi:hypothetical protein [Rhizobium sp. YTU87027]|uniref:hypothetical protein n=1 Tax=Rhizobium sp. YTU87027 TaxID=3417741 RepID=UPI003D68EA9E
MRAFIVATLLLLLTASLALFAFVWSRDVFYVVDTYRYRLTVNFMVDGKPLSASGVVQETIHKPPCILLEQTCGHVSIKGDAIPVQFPNGKSAFVLLLVVDGHRIAVGEYPSHELPRSSATGKLSASAQQEFAVSDKFLPDIVYFSRTDDPYSMTIVDPQKIDEVGGPGAKYVNATIAVTDDPVTRVMSNYLPWLSTFKSHLDASKVDFSRYVQMQNLVRYLRRDDL